MSMTNLVAIDVETPRIDDEHSLEKEFIELIHMTPLRYYTKFFIRLIHVMIVYVVLLLETPKTPCR